jgi:hypothetical protein
MTAAACKSPEEKERDRKKAIWKREEAEKQKKTAELLKSLEPKEVEWAKLAPPLKYADKPYIKGKMVIVHRRANDATEILEDDVVGLGEMHAQSPTDVQTVVQTDCFLIPAGSYIVTIEGKAEHEEEKEKIPAYTSKCNVTLIDLSRPAIIARRTFENKKLDDKIESWRIAAIRRNKQMEARQPRAEIRDFLLGLPRI